MPHQTDRSGAGAPASGLPTSAAPCIMVVDDEPDLRDIIAEALEMSGYRVLRAGTGEEALAVARASPDFDLVVTDVRLPGMSGVELVDQLAASGHRSRAILISGYFVPQPLRSRLISKPFNISHLEQAILEELAR